MSDHLRRELDKFDSKCPHHIGGRHVCLGFIMECARKAQDVHLSFATKKRMLSVHASLFKSLPITVQEEFRWTAAGMISRKSQGYSDERERLQAALSLHKKRLLQEEQAIGCQNRIAQHWKSDKELGRPAEFLTNSKLITGKYARMMLELPHPPSLVAREFFHSMAVGIGSGNVSSTAKCPKEECNVCDRASVHGCCDWLHHVVRNWLFVDLWQEL